MNISFEDSLVCKTNGGDHPNSPCVFPFIYNNVKYAACTSVDNGGTPWCSTEVNGNGDYIDGKWGNCGPECSRGNDLYHCEKFKYLHDNILIKCVDFITMIYYWIFLEIEENNSVLPSTVLTEPTSEFSSSSSFPTNRKVDKGRQKNEMIKGIFNCQLRNFCWLLYIYSLHKLMFWCNQYQCNYCFRTLVRSQKYWFENVGRTVHNHSSSLHYVSFYVPQTGKYHKPRIHLLKTQ